MMNNMNLRSVSPQEQMYAPQPMGYISVPGGMVQANMTNLNQNLNMQGTLTSSPQAAYVQSPPMIPMPVQTMTNLSESIPKLPNFFENPNGTVITF